MRITVSVQPFLHQTAHWQFLLELRLKKTWTGRWLSPVVHKPCNFFMLVERSILLSPILPLGRRLGYFLLRSWIFLYPKFAFENNLTKRILK